MPKRIVAGIVSALLLVSVFSLVFNIQPVQSEAQTIIVPSDYPTIQGAVNAASSGDTILVHAGVYYEHVVINKTLSLKGFEGAVIDATFQGLVTPTIASWNGITILSNNTIVSGFRVRNAANSGIGVRANGCIVQNNLCQNCSAQGGISLYGETEGYTDVVFNQPQNNTIQGNTVRDCLTGIFSCNAHNNSIIQNQFYSNKYAGIYMFGYSSNNTIDSNSISQTTHTWSGEGGNGIALGTGANHNLIVNNTISNNSAVGCNIDLFGLGYPYPYSNIVYGNSFFGNVIQAYDSGADNIWDNGYSGGNFWSDYNGTDANHDGIGDSPYAIDVNNTDRYPLMTPIASLPTTPKTIIVPDDYSTIQAAINAANAGDTIYVRHGSYGPTYVNKAVTLVGENRESTFITGGSTGAIFGLIVEADNVTITGFTITGGRNGVGLYLDNVRCVNVSGNTINTGWGAYGPAAFEGDVSNSTFSGNSFNGGYELSGSFNNWNGTYPSGGNYWSGYAGVDLKKGPNQDQPSGDGIGDTPYVINANNTDYYPLMRPYTYFTKGIPFAYFNYTPNKLAGENVTFDASASFDLNGNIVNYAWDFGDGTNATSANPVATHAYGNVHSNIVKLTVTDNDGLTDTSTQTITVGMVPASISISTSSSSMIAGFKVDVAGTLRDVYGNPLTGKTVVLSYTFSGAGTWTPITSCITDNAGNYLATWIPTATGAFTLSASWSGTSTVSPANSTTTLNCLSYDQYVFSVESNSTITGLAFNAADHMLSFTATGPDGTKGYVRATVAKNFTANPAGVKVLVDGNQVECSPTSTSDSCILYFTYQHSTHTVTIDLSATSEPTPTPTPSPTATPTPTPTPTPTQTPQPTPTPTPTSNPTSTPQPEENSFTNWMLYLIPVAIAIIIITLILVWKRKNSINPKQPKNRHGRLTERSFSLFVREEQAFPTS